MLSTQRKEGQRNVFEQVAHDLGSRMQYPIPVGHFPEKRTRNVSQIQTLPFSYPGKGNLIMHYTATVKLNSFKLQVLLQQLIGLARTERLMQRIPVDS